MSRRQTDLEPGVEPDAGEPDVRRAQRSSAHSAAVVASRHAPAHRARRATDPPASARPPSGAHRRAAAARRRCAGCRGSCSRSIAAAFVVSSLAGGSSSKADLTYSQFVNQVDNGNVKSIDFNKSTGAISGKFNDAVNGKKEFSSSGPKDNLPDAAARDASRRRASTSTTSTTGSNILGDILLWVLPLVLIIGLFVWMSRRAQGQMGAVMNIGKSRAKVYNTEKPKTTFADVAGYGPVKQEISEVVDFLKNPGKFKEIGARIPKGVLLVGPARHRQDPHRPRRRR